MPPGSASSRATRDAAGEVLAAGVKEQWARDDVREHGQSFRGRRKHDTDVIYRTGTRREGEAG
jgi:hypothetical protein